ncbi:hypothetical protein COU56_00660 [Candidatus Pacearchaeota archaeon CG10_big_fil_rev_8_21_14_0_10_31_9]|nr:MAG: hypothetical protein COU56_00660 [Candidatus Pacearchaeota archaeon CG10_big_fil_rev_8_21_14_0_10_31_9]
MRDKTISTIGIVVSIIVGWDKISAFIQSFFDGLNAFLKSLPPMILLILIIILFWMLGKKK